MTECDQFLVENFYSISKNHKGQSSIYIMTQTIIKASRDGSFEDLLAGGRILFLKLNNFSTNRHSNSLPTLSYSPQESKPGKLKIKTIWPKTRYQWSICYLIQ